MFPPAFPLASRTICWMVPSNNSATNASGLPVKVHASALSKNGHCTATSYLKLNSPPFWRNKRIVTRVTGASNAPVVGIVDGNEERMQLNSCRKARQSNFDIDFQRGRLVQDGLVYRESFSIRSFEVGRDRKISMHALMNYLQDTALSHVRSMGLLADGFGSTPQMIKRDLIWVVNTMNIAIHRYPEWTDAVQIDTWKYVSGKNAVGCNWLVTDCKTGEILSQATSLNVMLNKKTRKPSKFIKEVKEELKPYLMNCNSVIHDHHLANRDVLQQIDVNTSDVVCRGITPGWNDMDLNHHVNHVKYIDWILESTPRSIKDCYELSGLTLKYRKECDRDNTLQSLSKIIRNHSYHSINDDDDDDNDLIELEHLLCLESGAEVLRGRTTWKRTHGLLKFS